MNHKCSFDELSEIFLEGIFPNAQMLVYTKRVSFCFVFFRTNLIDLVLAAIATPFLSFQQGSGKDVHGVSFRFVFFRTNLRSSARCNCDTFPVISTRIKGCAWCKLLLGVFPH